MKITTKVKLKRETKGRKKIVSATDEPEVESGRIPRVTKLMALAIKFDQMIRDGVVADMAELARLGHVSRARMTQIMNLLNLAPDIQEALLFLPRCSGRDNSIDERRLRLILTEAGWHKQRHRMKGKIIANQPLS